MDYWRPAPALERYVSGYHAYRIRLEPGCLAEDVFFPGWTNVRFTIADAPWSIRIGNWTFSPVPQAALFGPTSRAGYARFGRGLLVGAGVTPLGWARLFAASAAGFADRVRPLSDLIGDEAGRLHEAIERGQPVPELLDAWFGRILARTGPEDESVARIAALLNDPALDSVAEFSRQSGVEPRRLAALSRRHFGFTPKLLLRRARFMRALMKLNGAGHGA